ncbi:MAG: replicative helicase loader/inhibitor [Oscillospiraceae bacterium]
MTKTETIKILAVLKAEYPRTYAEKGAAELEAIINLWVTAFADDDYSTVSAAVMAYIVGDNKTFREPPGIGMIKDSIRKITTCGSMSEQEAWTVVARALKNSSSSSSSVRHNDPERKTSAQRNYDDMPPLIQQVVGSPGQLSEWAQMEVEVVQSVVASNFMRSYRARVESEREYLALPSSLRSVIAQLTDDMKLPQIERGIENA